ncbi:hypothetical protein PHYSODRAFT_480632, partial [Phytophthora sojae]
VNGRVAQVDCELTSSVSQASSWWQHRTIGGFTFAMVRLSVAWGLWWFGCPSKNWPPYRSLVPMDLPNKNTRKRLSDSRFRNCTRRKEQLQWSTVVNLLRRHNRSQR